MYTFSNIMGIKDTVLFAFDGFDEDGNKIDHEYYTLRGGENIVEAYVSSDYKPQRKLAWPDDSKRLVQLQHAANKLLVLHLGESTG
jgi:hypothetical protein